MTDDNGQTLYRGERMAVSDTAYRRFTDGPYSSDVVAILPHAPVPIDQARPYNCVRDARRSPAETKGEGCDPTPSGTEPCCGGDR